MLHVVFPGHFLPLSDQPVHMEGDKRHPKENDYIILQLVGKLESVFAFCT